MNQNQERKNRPTSVVIGISAFLVLVLLMIIVLRLYLPVFHLFKQTNLTISLTDKTSNISHGKDLLKHNNIQIDEIESGVIDYRKNENYQMVDVVYKYQDLPIFNQGSEFYFDKTGKFYMENRRGLIATMVKGNIGFGSNMSGYAESLKKNNLEINPKVSYKQALENTLAQNNYFSSVKTNGFKAQLGILIDYNYKTENYSGTLVWKIRANDKQPGCGNSMLCFPLDMYNVYAFVNAETGHFICSGVDGSICHSS